MKIKLWNVLVVFFILYFIMKSIPHLYKYYVLFNINEKYLNIFRNIYKSADVSVYDSRI